MRQMDPWSSSCHRLRGCAEPVAALEAWRQEQASEPAPGLRACWRRALLGQLWLRRALLTWEPQRGALEVEARLEVLAEVVRALEAGEHWLDQQFTPYLFAPRGEGWGQDALARLVGLLRRGREAWPSDDSWEEAWVVALQRLVGCGGARRAWGQVEHLAQPSSAAQALEHLWPHGSPSQRRRGRQHLLGLLEGSPWRASFLLEPWGRLVRLTGEGALLARLEALALLAQQEESEPLEWGLFGQVALAHQALGRGEQALGWLRRAPVGGLRARCALELAQARPASERGLWLEEAWAALLAWPEVTCGLIAQVFALDVARGARHLEAWWRQGRRELWCCAQLWEHLPQALVEEVAREAVSRAQEARGQGLWAVLEALEPLEGGAHARRVPEALRRWLWEAAPTPALEAEAWLHLAHWVPAEHQGEAMERLLSALEGEARSAARADLQEALRDLYLCLTAPQQVAWAARLAQEIAWERVDLWPSAVRDLVDPAQACRHAEQARRGAYAHQDRCLLRPLVVSLLQLLPVEVLRSHQQVIREALPEQRSRLERRLGTPDEDIGLVLCSPEEREALRRACTSWVRSPGGEAWEAARWWVAGALRLGGAAWGEQLLCDVLALLR